MKNLLSAALLLLCSAAMAQQTVQRTGLVANTNITEKYSVLKKDKNIKQGNYLAEAGDITLASGFYQNNERAGIWNFYNHTGKLIQTYNYTDRNLTFADTADANRVKYIMPRTNADDMVTMPVKLGGTLSLEPTLFPEVLVKAVTKDFGATDKAVFAHTYTIGKKGTITKHTVKVTSGNRSKSYQVDDSKLSADFTRFIPAQINNNAVDCKIVMLTSINTASPVYAMTDYPVELSGNDSEVIVLTDSK